MTYRVLIVAEFPREDSAEVAVLLLLRKLLLRWCLDLDHFPKDCPSLGKKKHSCRPKGPRLASLNFLKGSLHNYVELKRALCFFSEKFPLSFLLRREVVSKLPRSTG